MLQSLAQSIFSFSLVFSNLFDYILTSIAYVYVFYWCIDTDFCIQATDFCNVLSVVFNEDVGYFVASLIQENSTSKYFENILV